MTTTQRRTAVIVIPSDGTGAVGTGPSAGRGRLLATVTLLVALACAACGGSDDDEASRPGAAEPATAPSPTTAPGGQVVDVGDLAQGIVYDQAHDELAVAVRNPYRLLLLDPTTLQPTRSVSMPGKVRHLQVSADGAEVLVGAETANELLQVPVPDGSVVTTKVQSHPHDATGAANGDVIVGNEFSGSFSVVRDGRVVKTVSDLEQPGGVVVDGDQLAVVDVGAFTLSTYDLTTFARTGRVPAGEGPTHGAAAGDGRFAVTDTRGGQVLVYTLDPLRQVGSIHLGGSPYGITSDPSTGLVWVTLTARNELVGLDVSGDTPQVVATYPTVQQPDTVAVAPGSHTLWVAGTVGGQVQRITR